MISKKMLRISIPGGFVLLDWIKQIPATRPDRPILICFHHGGGSHNLFLPWAKSLLEDFELWLPVFPGRGTKYEPERPPFTDFSALVSALCAVLATSLNRPFFIFGHSFGSLIAFESARTLKITHGCVASRLLLSACVAPQISEANFWPEGRAPYLRPQPKFPMYLWNDEDLLEMRRKRLSGQVPSHPELVKHFLKLARIDYAVLESYTYKPTEPLEMPLIVFGGENDPIVNRADLEGWRAHAGNSFRMQMMPGDHFYFNSNLETFLSQMKLALLSG